MQKNVVLAIGLTIALYVVYFTYFVPSAPPPPPAIPGARQGTVGGAQVVPPQATPPGQAPRGVAMKYPPAPDEKISNGHVELTVASRGGALKSADAWGCVYHKSGDRAVPGDPGAATAWVDGVPGALVSRSRSDGQRQRERVGENVR